MNTGRTRLLHLREQAEAVGEDMQQEAPRFQALARDESAPRVVTAFNLFQTPEHIAARMAEIVADHIGPRAKVLEPSAGLGRLYRAMRDAGHDGLMILAEQSPDCCRELYDMTAGDQGARLLQGDFLTMQPGTVDAVIMNPPFKLGRDVKHIKHALTMLRPGGLLVSLCFNGTRQNKELKPIVDSWEVLPSDSFKSEGTRASVALLTITA